jgi:hypothetical protein
MEIGRVAGCWQRLLAPDSYRDGCWLLAKEKVFTE